MENKVKFISYDKNPWGWCFGILTIEMNGKLYKLKDILISGGSIGWDGDTEEVITGPWKVKEEKLPEKLKPYIKEIEEIVNNNVEYGCCGGCI